MDSNDAGVVLFVVGLGLVEIFPVRNLIASWNLTLRIGRAGPGRRSRGMLSRSPTSGLMVGVGGIGCCIVRVDAGVFWMVEVNEMTIVKVNGITMESMMLILVLVWMLILVGCAVLYIFNKSD